jgi:beta-1,2-mannobiose phosphorylase / 1,2-beta-oligomannan phosphorylase
MINISHKKTGWVWFYFFYSMHRLPADSNKRIPLGIAADSLHVYLYYNLITSKDIQFRADISENGISFAPSKKHPVILDRKKEVLPTKKFSGFRVSQINKKHLLIYKFFPNQNTLLCNAISDDLLSFQKVGKISGINETGAVVPNFTHQGKYLMYYGDDSIHLAESGNGSGWKPVADNLLSPVQDFYGTYGCQTGSAIVKDEGILLFFYMHRTQGPVKYISLHAALFAKNNPKKLLWQTHEPLWQIPKSWMRRKVFPIGILEFHGMVISYWNVNDEIFAIQHPEIDIKKLMEKRTFHSLLLERIKDNPIIKPIADHFWESRATFNPAAVYDKGKVHIIYRAIGNDDVSTMGYATSTDGINIDYRHPEPIYVPTQPWETGGKVPYISSGRYASGGGCWGGCEDPRVTKIDNKYYMMYVAYDGRSAPRVAMTSIDEKDFHAGIWKGWQTPVLISRPGEVNKNACVLSEKINGKYVIFHRVFPNILIDYVDSLDQFNGNTFLKGHYKISPRSDAWDSRKLGIGAPPIKTDDGWLLIYQAVDDKLDRQYKIGAMLLDLDDPTKVICRPKRPILEPIMHYENQGHKAGVVYPCGSVIKDNSLFVYYGGADMVTCVATAPIDDFLSRMKASEPAKMNRIVMHL